MKPKSVHLKTEMMTVVFLLAAVVGFAEGPSFDCEKASTCVEKLICNDKELSELDKKMSEAYESLLAQLQGEDNENVRRSQIIWIKERNERCLPPYKIWDETYFGELYFDLYTERIEELREWKKYAAGEKTTNFPPWRTMCWKRQEPIGRQLRPITGDAPICRAFELVLNTTCEPPKELGSNWTIPSNEKRFQKLIWQPLDWREYWGLIEDMVKAGLRKDLREEVWKKEDPNVGKEVNEMRRMLSKITVDEATLRKEFEEGGWRLSVATVDIDHDNHPELLVRQDRVPPPGSIFGVMIPDTKRLDWSYEPKLAKINRGNEGAEIMFYEGKIYYFGWQGGWDFLFIWDEENWAICKFKYLKGGNEK